MLIVTFSDDLILLLFVFFLILVCDVAVHVGGGVVCGECDVGNEWCGVVT